MTNHRIPEDVLQDLRYGVRTLWRNAGFAATVVLTLAVGIAAVVTLFSVLDAVILRRLPYSDADRLALAWTVDTKSTAGAIETPVSLPDLEDWQTLSPFERIAGFRSAKTFLRVAESDLSVELNESTSDFFPALGISPVLGRIWTSEEAGVRTPRPLVISHALWRDMFGGDAGVLGRTVVVSQVPFEVIGVMPRGFRSPSASAGPSVGLSQGYAVWAPFVPRPVHRFRGNRGLRVIARLRAGTSLDAAQLALTTMSDRLATTYPDSNSGRTARLTSLAESITGRNRRALEGMVASGALLLLIAGTNAAFLLLIRTSARQREWSARVALGATWNRLVRQLLIESTLLAAMGGALGIGLSAIVLQWGVHVFADSNVPRLTDAVLNERSIGLGLLLAIVTGLIVGAMPIGTLAVLTARVEPPGVHIRTDRRSYQLRHTLVATQVALALTLAVSAALLFLNVSRLVESHGFHDPHRTLAFQTTVAGTRWTGEEGTRQLYEALRERLESVPGVDRVALTSHVLSLGDASSSDVVVDGAPPTPADERPLATYSLADVTFLSLSGATLKEGRTFDRNDRPGGPRVAIVNQAFAIATGLEGSALGRRVRLSGLGLEPFRIVGIVADSHALELGRTDGPRLYYSAAQLPASRFVVLVRWQSGTLETATAVRQAVRDIDAQLPILDLQTVAQAVERTAAQPRWSSTLIASFATVALFLASIGVYGLVAYTASQRTKECGIRVALGATRLQVWVTMAKQGLHRWRPVFFSAVQAEWRRTPYLTTTAFCTPSTTSAPSSSPALP